MEKITGYTRRVSCIYWRTHMKHLARKILTGANKITLKATAEFYNFVIIVENAKVFFLSELLKMFEMFPQNYSNTH